jgi:TetR/AcrR family transcriptional regulator, repressor of the mexAB-oprM multidrug resistance operon
MARRTRAEAEATREAILDAAELEFLERGVSGTTLAHIAHRAGVTRGAIYWHFKDKAALFAAMLERVRLPFADIADRYRREVSSDDPLGLLRELCRLALAKLDESETYRNVYSILFNRCEYAGEVNPAFSRQTAIDEESLRRVEEDFRQARMLGQLSPRVDPRLATLALYSLMQGIYLSWLRDPGRFDIRADGNAMLELFFAGLRGAGGGVSGRVRVTAQHR